MSPYNLVQKDNLTDLVHAPKPPEPPKTTPSTQQKPTGQVIGSNGQPINLGFGVQNSNPIRK